jgi:hypothetical protein
VGRPIATVGALLVAGASVLAGCAHETYQPAPARVEAPAGPVAFDDCELADGSTVPSEFPKGALAPAGSAESALACGLSAQLAALGEPSFFPLSQSAEVYRVLWIRSDGHPVSVRLDRQGSAGQLRGAQTSGKGFAPPGDLLEETTGAATPDLVRMALTGVEAAHFWATSPPPAAVPAADHGSTWVFEGVRAGQYRARVFQRDTLARDPAYNSLARTLLGASGLHIQGAVY